VSAFVNADGTVTVPPRVAAKMLRLVTLGVLDARKRGIAIDLDMLVVLDAMNVATLAAERPASATGTTVAGSVTVDGDAGSVLLSTDQAAARIGCTPRAVRAAIGRGQLRATRPGGRAWVIRANDLDHYAHGGRDG
jgi:excisionase family DNA binding protein